MLTTIPKRTQVKKEDTWRLEDLFASDTIYATSYEDAQSRLEAFSQYRGKLATYSSILLDFLQKQDDLWTLINKLYVYAHMRLHEDGSNDFYQALSQQSEQLCIKANSLLAFATPELSTLTEETLATFYSETPALKHYARYLQEILRQKAHILDAKTEALLSETADIAGIPQQTFAMLNNVDLKFPMIDNIQGEKLPLTHATYIPLMESSDRHVRETAFNSLYSTYGQYKHTFASLFAGNIKQYSLFARTRQFHSPLEMALNENNIPIEVYHRLITTVNSHLDILHDYMALRKEVLHLEELHMYDLFVPMVNDCHKTITFEEAKEIVLKALSPLGEDYLNVVRSAFTSGWIDKYENEGKRSGAYSWGAYGAPHPYILLNHTPNMNSLFTLAHEMGHAMHTYYSHQCQPHIYGDYCIFVAEVASTVNEALLMQYLLKTTSSKEERRYLLNYFMDQFKSTLYRQTMFAQFELEMHTRAQQGETLTCEVIASSYEALIKKYHGPAVTVDPAIALEWARIPHFYTPFYVYQYATGYSAAIALSHKILEEGASAVTAYKQFLSGGSSQDPIDLLKIAGVDMSTAAPIEAALTVFKELIAEFKKN